MCCASRRSRPSSRASGSSTNPDLKFDRLDALVAFLNRIADATGEQAVREYAEQIKLEGDATEKVVRSWKNRKEVSLEGEVKKAITAAKAKSKAAQK